MLFGRLVELAHDIDVPRAGEHDAESRLLKERADLAELMKREEVGPEDFGYEVDGDRLVSTSAIRFVVFAVVAKEVGKVGADQIYLSLIELPQAVADESGTRPLDDMYELVFGMIVEGGRIVRKIEYGGEESIVSGDGVMGQDGSHAPVVGNAGRGMAAGLFPDAHGFSAVSKLHTEIMDFD